MIGPFVCCAWLLAVLPGPQDVPRTTIPVEHRAEAASPDVRPEALLKAIMAWAGAEGWNQNNLIIEDKPAPFFRDAPPWGWKQTGPWHSARAVSGSGWSNEEAQRRVVPELSALAPGEPRLTVSLGQHRRFGPGNGVAIHVYNPIVRNGLAFVEGDQAYTGAYLYVFEWRKDEWVPVAIMGGPVF